MLGFSSWYELTDENLEANAPGQKAAIQVRRADGLVDYPSGKSAMVWYGIADDVAGVLRDQFADELDQPGIRGCGTLEFRYYAGPRPRERIEKVAKRFVQRFGSPPVFNDAED